MGSISHGLDPKFDSVILSGLYSLYFFILKARK